MKRFLIAALVMVMCGSIVVVAEAIEEKHDTDPSSDCIATWDPFCPLGTPTGGGDDSYPGACQDCLPNSNGDLRCAQVAEGQTGRHSCTTTWYETTPISCTASGEFCENISVTP